MKLNWRALAIASFIHVPLVMWLHPPWYAAIAMGMAAYSLAKASL